MSAHEVVVVGAGPAGSTAARRLAEGGVPVLLLDKARFPRPKVCGGALSPRALRHAPPAIEGRIRARVHRAVFTYCSTQPFEITAPRPLGYVVRREEFDHWLVERAAAAGATVRDGARAEGVEREGAGIALRVSGDRMLARIIIGADGAGSGVADALCPQRQPAPLMGLQAEIAGGFPEDDTVLVDVGRYPGGYAWAFPGGGRAHVGVMLDRTHGRQLEGALGRFLTGAGASCRPDGIRAAPVAAFRDGVGDCAAPATLLVGDAARLADPFLGEGISYAMWSGSLAAEAILAGGDGEAIARRYRAAVEGAIRPELRAAGRFARLFHCLPRWWHRQLSRHPDSIHRYAGILAGEGSYQGLSRQVSDRLEAGASRWVLKRLGLGRDKELKDIEMREGVRHG